MTAAGYASGAAPGSWPGPAPAAARPGRRPGSTSTAGRYARSAAAGMTRAATANAARAGRPRRSQCAAGTASRASASTATGCPRPPAANAIGGARAPTRQPASRSAPRAHRGPPPSARAAGTTGRRKPAGRRDRCATRVTAPPCGTGGRARAAASSAGWSPRPARALTPAPTAPGSRSSAPAPTAAPKTSSTRKAAAHDARLRRRARDLLSAGTGIIPAQLSGVFDAVTAARQPRSALNWLRKGAGAGLLADVAAGRLAISHEALDACPHRRAADYLRHMLTAAGALPPATRNSPAPGNGSPTILEAIEPAADRRLVQAYATWQVMRRLRASAAAAARPRTPTAHARNNIRAAASLLAWLRGRGTELDRLRASRHRPVAAHRAVGLPGQGFPGLGRLPRPLPEAEHPGTAARDRSRHQPGPAVGADRPAAARHRARPHRPGRRVPAPALRPAAVPHRRHDHQPGHPPRRPDVPSGSAATTCLSPARSPAPSSS